ncbi:thiamine phosphate synthase [Sphingobacterium haloxyli]|uniref:Thiamine-phosphate synthase n=1 Tax=Sphingobacterium haloxyli TaxID=2100533 RepID=A0A2S9J2V3_9SPHI|nr:thiamine phosphate synthase [Sphingobacterium haloxyli]PRD47111.1 thiamine phosphate synthase [Sphingobacterium haloxyli]
MNTRAHFPYQLYLVISQADCGGRGYLEVAEQAILGGVDIIQLREKLLGTAGFLEAAKRLKDITDKHNIPLIINDNLQVAMSLPAAGIHVGNSDIPPVQIRSQWDASSAYVGYSIEYIDQLANKQAAVSDYLGISPVFRTATKSDTVTEWSLDGITQIRQLTSKKLVAIGNIDKHNARAVVSAGADCIAVVSAVCGARDPLKAAYELKNELLK